MNQDIALTLANQAAEIERLKERVEALTQLVGQLDLRLADIEGKPLHPSDRSEMVPVEPNPPPVEPMEFLYR